jgi:two-component system cell cycle sensor histidine kinase/response regulator CckA
VTPAQSLLESRWQAIRHLIFHPTISTPRGVCPAFPTPVTAGNRYLAMDGRFPDEQLPHPVPRLLTRGAAVATWLAAVLLVAVPIVCRHVGAPLPSEWVLADFLLASACWLGSLFITAIRKVLLPPIFAELTAARREAAAFRHAAGLARLAAAALTDGHHRVDAVVQRGALLLHPMRTTEKGRSHDPQRQTQPAASEITGALLGTESGGKPPRRQAIDFNQVIQEVAAQMPRLLGPRIQIETNLARDLPRIEGNAGQLHQIMLTLALNAGEAMPDGGKLGFITRPLYLPDDNAEGLEPGRYIEIAISDNGVGISEEVVGRIFDPFFTTKPLAAGTGLGLAMVRSVVENHGGTVDVFTQEEEGTTFTLLFPVATSGPLPPASTPTSVVSSRMVGGSETILVVDDDEVVCRTVQKILGRAGYNSIATSDAAEALRLFRAHHDAIDLVLLDLSSSVIDGDHLCREICRIAPAVRFLFSGRHGSAALPDTTRGPVGFLQKPYRIQQMTEAIRKVLDRQQ